jgi:hypothetical protein
MVQAFTMYYAIGYGGAIGAHFGLGEGKIDGYDVTANFLPVRISGLYILGFAKSYTRKYTFLSVQRQESHVICKKQLHEPIQLIPSFVKMPCPVLR